jgi:exosortase
MPYLIILWSGLAMYSYRHVIGDLLDQWQIHPSYSHGPIVIPIAIWLLWHRRSSRPDVAQPWIAGIGLLLAAHILLWLGGYFYLPAIQRWTIPLWLCGMIGLVGGRGVLSWSLPGVCFLAFMIPVPYQLEMVANQTLQWASAWCSCFLLGLSSTIAVTDGYTIRMETGRVGITSDCSGLRMTVAIAALSYVITFLNHQRLRRDRSGGLASLGLPLHLAAMMLLVIPAAILANAARIAVMAFVVDRYQQESYTSWAHDLGEWLVLPGYELRPLACTLAADLRLADLVPALRQTLKFAPNEIVATAARDALVRLTALAPLAEGPATEGDPGSPAR